MHIVVIHGWQKNGAEVAATIADAMGTLVFEAQQKITGGGPTVLASFAEQPLAEALAGRLTKAGVPALVIDPSGSSTSNQPFRVRRFVLGSHSLQLEAFSGEPLSIDYGSIELLLSATCSSGQMQTTSTVQERKFSLGKTMLAGGVPMTKKVTREETVTAEQRDETLWLYHRDGATVIFDRAHLNFDGLGAAMQMSRNLNFVHLKNEVRRLAPQAHYDDRLLNKAGLVRLLGRSLNPEDNLDLAFEILALCLMKKAESCS